MVVNRRRGAGAQRCDAALDMRLDPIKIVRIIGRLNIGGPAIHAVLLTEGLNEGPFRSILVTGTIGDSEGDMLHVAERWNIVPLFIPELGREISWRDDLVALWKLYRIMARERPAIVHTHTAKSGALGRVAAVLARVPIKIHTFHGHVFHDYFGPLKTRLFIAIERVLALFTTRIIAISETQKAELSGRYRIAVHEKFAVIPIGLDLLPLLQCRVGPDRKMPRGDAQEVVIGFVGRLVPIKNPSMAIRAFERLLRGRISGSRLRLVVAGDGELRPALEEQVRQAGLEPHIQFIGWQKDVAALYSQFDLVILTSLNEGTPVALIEAMAAGLPFVATQVGGMPDLMVGPAQEVRTSGAAHPFMIFSNGALAEPGDEEGFANALTALVEDPARMRCMGAEGRRFVAERFAKERLVSDVRALYQHCLDERAGMEIGAGRKLSWARQPQSGRKVGA